MAQQQIKVGLVGAGLSATTFHLPFLQQSNAFKVVGVLRSSSKPLAGLEVPVYADLHDLLAAEQQPELVVITTPTHTHYSLAKQCLEAGRHVVLEKPMTASADEAHELCSLARQQDKLLAVYHNRRWDGDFLTAAALIKCGVLGRVVQFESHFDRYRPALKPGWKEDASLPGAGVFYDLGSHLVDQALALFGPPSAITGLVMNERHLPICGLPDAFSLTLHYDRPEGPLTVLLRSSSLCKIPGPRFTVHGTQGSWVKHGMDVQEAQLREGLKPLQPGFGFEQPDSYGTLDSQALELNPALQAPAPAGPLEALPEVPEGGVPVSPAAAAASVAAEAADAALDAAAAAAEAGKAGGTESAVTVSSIAAAVLAKIDAGPGAHAAGKAASSSSSSSTGVKVVTLQGSWHKFYEEVGTILAAAHQQQEGGLKLPQGSQLRDSWAPAPGTLTEAAGAVLGSGTGHGSTGSGSGGQGQEGGGLFSSHGINGALTVPPEAAAEVIRVIEKALQSSKEGRTLPYA